MLTYTSIVPAAGASRRMGQAKLLLPWQGAPLIAATLAALAEGGSDSVVVVVRPDDRRLATTLGDYSVTVTTNPRPEDGMLSSILCGLASEPGHDADAWLICPADLPGLRPETVRSVIQYHRDHAAPLIVPVSGHRRGHPLLIDRSMLDEVRTLDPAVGLRQLVRDPQRAVVEVSVDDPGCLRDVDTPDDYRQLRDRPVSRRT